MSINHDKALGEIKQQLDGICRIFSRYIESRKRRVVRILDIS